MSLFVNHLTHLDVSLWCPKQGLMGCSWQVDVQLDGELGEDGMLLDFGQVKPWIKHTLDSGLDHTLLVPVEAVGVDVSDCSEGICVRTTFPYAMEVRGPAEAFTLLPWKSITIEHIAHELSEALTKQRPANIDRITLSLTDEAIEGASYGYSHGLKRHIGNCQRIAHGHRSRLYIWQGNKRQEALERHWATWLDNRYLLEQADVTNQSKTSLTCGYMAAQGKFSITLPLARCSILPHPTTVENIARWLAKRIAEESGQPTFVQAFEGINKGATAGATP